MSCPFCLPPDELVAAEAPRTRVLRDLYPVTPGHLLVVPRRHVARWDDASIDERLELIDQLDRARQLAAASDDSIEAFNLGWNDGVAAGQTIMHLHLHVIPRRRGDVEDPRGGIRWIIRDRADYWSR